jgi:membrane protease YdiL (CAAX protease family)
VKKIFRFKPTKDTLTATIAGAVMIGLSLLMLPFSGDSGFDKIVSFLLRDVLMIFGLGIVFVTLYVDKKGKDILQDIGFTRRRMVPSIVLDVVFAAALAAMFMMDGMPSGVLNLPNLFAAAYILTAGVFEMTFIYGFLRMSLEKAFGIIPAIILTSAFYSFHHAGFQPEFLHLFLVGLMYCSVFYITRNMLIIFPFFWGTGALWDVIISSEAGEGISNAESFIFAVIVWCLICIWFICRNIRRKKNAVENIDRDNGNAYQG